MFLFGYLAANVLMIHYSGHGQELVFLFEVAFLFCDTSEKKKRPWSKKRRRNLQTCFTKCIIFRVDEWEETKQTLWHCYMKFKGNFFAARGESYQTPFKNCMILWVVEFTGTLYLCETLSMINSWLFGPSCKFGKCYTSSSSFLCVKNIMSVCTSDVRVYYRCELTQDRC